MHVKEIVKSESGCKIARYAVSDVLSITKEGTVEFKDFIASVNLDDRVLISATYGGKPIALKNAIVVLNTIGLLMVHPMLHAFTNWATNTASINPYFRRISVVTILFNHYGFTGYHGFMEMLYSCGVIKTNGKTWDAIMSIFQKQAPKHKKVRELMPYSKFVQFVVQTRNFFMNEFAQCQADFPGIDGEALYLMSVFHSCDHASFLIAQRNWDCPGLPGNVDEEFLMAWEI